MAVWEVVHLAIADGAEDEFESAVRSNLSLLQEGDGALDLKVLRAEDKPGVFLILVLWKSIEHHTEVFRKTTAYTKYYDVIAPFITAPPEFFHASTVIDGF